MAYIRSLGLTNDGRPGQSYSGLHIANNQQRNRRNNLILAKLITTADDHPLSLKIADKNNYLTNVAYTDITF